jgi:hypothetical protein
MGGGGDGSREMPNMVLWGKVKNSDKLKDVNVYGRIILKWVLVKVVKCELDSS